MLNAGPVCLYSTFYLIKTIFQMASDKSINLSGTGCRIGSDSQLKTSRSHPHSLLSIIIRTRFRAAGSGDRGGLASQLNDVIGSAWNIASCE
jgi:hypothetical protein